MGVLPQPVPGDARLVRLVAGYHHLIQSVSVWLLSFGHWVKPHRWRSCTPAKRPVFFRDESRSSGNGFEPSVLFIMRFTGVRLRVTQQQFHAICSPSRDTSSKEVCIFGPDRTFQRQRGSEHRPILFITLQALTRCFFERPVYFGVNTPSLLKDFWKMFSSLCKGRKRSEESDFTTVTFKDLPNALSQYCANQYVRVEYDHFDFEPCADFRRASLNSLTSSSSLTPLAARSASSCAAAVRSAARCATFLLGRVGI